MKIGQRIKSRRSQLRLTQFEVAKKLSVSSQVVSNWERGYTPVIPPEYLLQLAVILDTSPDYLLGQTDDPNPKRDTKQSDLEEEWPEVLNVLRRAGRKPTLKERRRLATIVKAAIKDPDDDDDE